MGVEGTALELLSMVSAKVLVRLEVLICCLQVANFDTVREKFGGSAAAMVLHDRIADVLLTATALSAESPGVASDGPVVSCPTSAPSPGWQTP